MANYIIRMDYKEKYLKYKAKYLKLKKELEGGKVVNLPEINGARVDLENNKDKMKKIVLIEYDPASFGIKYILRIYSRENIFSDYNVSNNTKIENDNIIVTADNTIKAIEDNSSLKPKYFGTYTFNQKFKGADKTKLNKELTPQQNKEKQTITGYYISSHTTTKYSKK
jgi:hypothetical protein